MRRRMKKLLAVALLFAFTPVFTAGAVRTGGASPAAGSAAPAASAGGVFEEITGKIADWFDQLLFRFRAVTLKKGETAVKTDALTYIASGFESRSGDAYRIREGFTARFYGMNRPFHRLTFRYASTQPLRLDVTYRVSGADTCTAYYLEAAEEGCFRCLIEQYLRGGKARKLVSVRARTCTGEPADFSLREISTEKLAPLGGETCFVENERFKVGVRLGWGGGVNYLADKTCPVEGITNLINQHDTGRLVQQSYYGTAGNDAYQPGTSFKVRWVYNPVQGGDQFGNASRLIDFEVGENTVYVKAQPQDWSLDNALTPSYMENTYTLFADHVRVDNRFTDFSGWEHPARDQELPAFYTVSYLSRFTWYDGASPWSDGALSYRDDLKFWGEYSAECTFPVRPGNTETWCAWISPESGFGVGLYVPNVDTLKAGRYLFNNSKDPENDATNYVAPLKVIRMTSFRPIEYSYLLTSGSTEQIRETFRANRGFTDNAGLNG